MFAHSGISVMTCNFRKTWQTDFKESYSVDFGPKKSLIPPPLPTFSRLPSITISEKNNEAFREIFKVLILGLKMPFYLILGGIRIILKILKHSHLTIF